MEPLVHYRSRESRQFLGGTSGTQKIDSGAAPGQWASVMRWALGCALLVGLLLGSRLSWAQCATSPVTLDFSTRGAGEDWKNRPLESMPSVYSFTKVGTTYTSNPANANVTLTTATLNGVATLGWSASYAATANTSTVTFNFSRTVSNVSIRVQDIDGVFNPANLGNLFISNGFIDEVTFTGSNGGPTLYPTLTKVNPSSTHFSIGGTNNNVATGNTAAGDNTSPTNATVIATFSGSLTSITLQYRNVSGASALNSQSVGIDQLSWCRIVPTAANVTTATLISNLGQQSISGLSGTADGTPSYTIVTLPANGTLQYNSSGATYTNVTAGQTITAAQAATLRYTPDAAFTGSSTSFTYRTNDDASQVSPTTATYTIPLQYIAPCGTATNTLNFSTRPAAEDWKAHAALAVPTGSAVTTISSGSYSNSAATVSTFQIGTANGATDLVWNNDYSGTGRTSSVTFTFNRAVSNFTVRIQDIDADAPSNFADVVTFAGANGATAVTPTLVLANPGAGITSISGNVATGLSATTSTVDGTVTAYFPSAITTFTLTYANGTSATDPGNQLIGIQAMSWCRQAPVANNVTTTSVLSAAGQQPINALSGTADGTVASYTITALPTNGTLFYNSSGSTYTAVTLNQTITAAQAATLRYAPDGAFTGSSTTFTYRAVDDAGVTSANTATYTIPLQYIAPCATATNTLDFSGRPAGEDWKAHAALAAPSSVTTVSSGSYSNSAATASTLQIGTINGVNSLAWTNDYSGTGRSSSVTFTFNRAVSNFTVRVQDIDAAAGFIDVVTFAGANGGTAVTPTLVATNPGAGVVGISGTTATGLANTENTTDGTVTAYFPSAITTLTLTYANGTAQADPGNQAIGIDPFTWCRQAPVANNVTTSTVLSAAGQQPISPLSGTADGTVTNYTITALPANGTLQYNSSGTTYTNVTVGQTITAAQAATLRYTPNAGFSGSSTSFTYRVTDDASLTSANTATYTIPLQYIAPCGTATNTLDFATRPAAEDWKAHAALPVPTSGSDLTTISSGSFSSSPATTSVFQIGTANSAALVWNNDYSGTGRTSSVTFTFNRAVSNFTVRIQDIDADAPSNFADVVTFAGANGATAVTPTLVLANPGAGITSISGNVATGLSATTSTVDGTVTAYFPSAITTFTLTYANGTSATDPGNQLIGIETMTWCRLAPVAANITNTSRPSGQAATAINPLSAQADGTVASYTITALPPASQGTYFVNGTALTSANLTLTPAQAAQLTFAPAAGFSGNAGFSYFATDNAGIVSNTATYTIPVTNTGGAGTPAPCATPGKDGSPTLSVNPDTYYPGTASAAAGATSITVGAGTIGGAPGIATSISRGDLLLVIQMQGADFNSTNTDAYGDGVSGGGASGNLSTNFVAGRYEYVTASNTTPVTAAAGGTITLASPLVNSYASADVVGTAGPRRFQVVRVPQFGNLTLGGTITPTPWNGSIGGILAIDVAGQTNFSGQTINASARGFRGGGGIVQTTSSANSTDYVTLTSAGLNAQKGEGTVGTPRFVNVPTTPGDATTNATVDLTTGAYPGGSTGRGAPGNAGGGGNDNVNNSGGGGGANGGFGGRGGNNFSVNMPIGGEPGASFDVVSSSRLVLGGGGGAGTSNDGTGTPGSGAASSGAAGGGIVLLRTGTITGTGTILANGGSANTSATHDGSGGGGAGGSILVTATTPAGLANLTLRANGGAGGNNTGVNPNSAPGSGPHGPGGGGGGGVVLANGSVAASSVTGGANGTTQGTPAAFGATSGANGVSNLQISNSIAGSTTGTICVADVTTALTGPATLTPAQPSGTYTATFTNNGPSTANNVTRTVTLPAGATNILVNGVAYTPTTANTIDFGTAPSLASGASSSFTFSFTPATTATGTLNIVSSVGTDSGQGVDAAANTSTIQATVPAVADVAANIVAGTAVAAGTPAATGGARFTATFTNNGPTAAAGVVPTVQLPAGLTNVTATNGGSYNSTTGLVTYAGLTTLANGATTTSVITFDAPATGPVAATANISTATSQAGQTSNDRSSASLTINPAFDLTTTLSGPASSVAGDLVTLAITTSSAATSLSTATTVVQTAQLPTGLTNVYLSNGGFYNASTSATTVTYNGVVYTVPAGGVIFPPLATLPAGQSMANTVSFVMPATAFAPTATVTPNTTGAGDTNTANNTAYLNGAANSGAAGATLTVAAPAGNPANVYTRLTSSVTTVAAGSPVTLTVTTGNNGSATSAGGSATGVVQMVQLLPSFGTGTLQVDGQTGTLSGNIITFSTSGATYNTTTGMLMFPAITQASGASVTHSIAMTAPASVGNNGQLLATAFVTQANVDPIPADNVAAVNIGILTATELATTIAGPATAVVGQPVTYTATFINNGPSTASGYNLSGTQTSGVTQTAQLPVGLTGVTITDASGATVTGASYDASTGLVTFPTLTTDAVGATQVYNLNFLAPAQSLTVRSSVTTASPDGTPANNSASATTTITPAADLVTTVTGPATAVIGNPVTYVVNTTNNGPSAAASVVPTLLLPTGFTAATLSVNGLGGTLSGNLITFSDGSTYNTTTGLVTFPSTASLPSGRNVLNRVSFVMPNAVGGQLAGVASATSTTTDLNPGNNGGSVATSIAPATATTSDLVATVTPSAGTVAAGSPLTLTATFTNNGPDAATNVTPTLQLPAGLTGVTVSNGGSYNAATGLVTWPAIASAATAATASYTVSLTAPAAGPLAAVAAISSSTSEPGNVTALNNNIGLASVTITPVFNAVTRLSGRATALPGTPQTYTVTSLNTGISATANATTQVVTLPAGVTPSNITGSGVYNSGANTITWTIPAGQVPGANGAVANSFTITQPAAGATIAANVTVTGESNTGDNTASLTTTATNQPPTAAAVVNALQAPTGNTAANSTTAIYGTLISPLVASDPENALSSTAPYTIVSIPASTQGTLYYNTGGSTYAAATAGQTLTAAQAATLRFLPTLNYVGNAMFNYLATDNAGNQSATVMYTVPVGQDQAATYTSTPLKGGANQYQNGDIITSIVDPNGSRYNAAGRVYDPTTGALQGGAANGLPTSGTNAVLTAGTLPPGVSLDPITGQLYVSNRTLLPRAGATAVVSITTTDVNGGVSTVVETITLGAYPLPVELTEFTAQAVRNVDGVLKWNTASEKNNDHFDVERSRDGRSFEKFAEVKGQGSKASPTDYTLTDANAAKLAGTVYYRLKQVDTDGSTSYSPVRTISFTKPLEPAISLWPNPAVGETNLDLSQLPLGDYQVSVLDATGRSILSQTLPAGSSHRLALRELANGAYFVVVRGTAGNASLTLTKRLLKE